VKQHLGALALRDGSTEFVVWAPTPDRVELLVGKGHRIPMERDPAGYWSARVPDVRSGTLYQYILDGGTPRADPASRSQPEGPGGPSAVVNPSFEWTDLPWRGIPTEKYVIYELHVGTFTAEGTFDAIISHLDELRELGITALELMPIAEFSGDRNWGYDGVLLFAAHHSYGGPDGLRRLVDACHARNLAVVLDVVYNHIGPEHNHLAEFAPYFTERFKTPWGPAVNLDAAESDHVRRFFIENALYWVTECHVDALRLDAVHALLDLSAVHFLEDLSSSVEQRARQLGRKVQLIAESDLNAPRMVEPRERGGYGMDAQWLDDFHHALHVLLTDERSGYYESYGDAHDLAKAYRENFVYTGQYSSIRKRRHGRSARDIPPCRFVVCAQNHDQIGNRMLGDRLAATLELDRLKLSAAAVLLSPFIPLLFMGEEYGDPAPFAFFVSHEDDALVDAVRKGRVEEFADFKWAGEPHDPHAAETFESAKLDRSRRDHSPHAALYALHHALLRLREDLFGGAGTRAGTVEARVIGSDSTIVVVRPGLRGRVALLLNFRASSTGVPLTELGPAAAEFWRTLLDTAASEWDGGGSNLPETLKSSDTVTLAPWSAVVLHEESRS
jgi:maltooligosyltrehalose trehalohydrolase